MNKSVVIVAGGYGARMNNATAKQFIVLNDLPILMHTIKRFYDYDPKIKIIVVIPKNETENWNSLIKKFSFSIKHEIIPGGSNRFQSVQNGLSILNEHCIVAIHDGVRPLCSSKLINRCFDEAEKNSNAIPAITLNDSVRLTINNNNSTIDRDSLRIIQTPQCFDSILLKKAYQNSASENFTDDASVFENDGNKIHLVEGEKTNIKITYPEDLIVASVLEKSLLSK